MAMKASGVPWIGDIPYEWELSKVKYGFDRKKDKSTEKDPVVLSLARSGVKIRDISTNEGQLAASYEGYNPVEPNDLLLNPMDLISGANCSISHVSGVISPAYMNLRARQGFDPRYYDYFFKTQYWSMALFIHGKGVSFDNRWTLNENTLRDYIIPMPTIAEQEDIADYLDTHCSQIDEIIAEATASIEEYKKLKQAVITEAVTGGLKTDIELKHSGYSWLGLIPNDWNIVPLKYVSTKTISYGVIKLFDPDENGVRILRCSDVKAGFIDTTNIRTITRQLSDEYKRTILSENDVVVNVRGTLGGCAVVPKSMEGYNIAREVALISPDKTKYDSSFIMYCLLSNVFERYRDMSLSGAIYVGINMETLTDFRLAYPPLIEQEEISRYLDTKVSAIDALISEKQSLIDDLQAYKKSLIYEVVTGKRRVV